MVLQKFFVLALSLICVLSGSAWGMDLEDDQETLLRAAGPVNTTGRATETEMVYLGKKPTLLLTEHSEQPPEAAASVSLPLRTHQHPEWVCPRRDSNVVRVLILPGGGIRGIILALMLTRIEEKTGRPIHELFDVITGTSTGAIAASAVSFKKPGEDRPYTAQELLNKYQEMGSAIFYRSYGDIITHAGGLIGPQYRSTYRNEAFQKFFGDTPFGEAACHLVVPSYDIQTQTVVFHKTRHAKKNGIRVTRVLEETTSAPTYFSPTGSRVDGGIFDNFPGLTGKTEAQHLFPGQKLLVVALGTGYSDRSISPAAASKYGTLAWIRPLLDCMMDGQKKKDVYQLKKELGPDFYHFDPELKKANSDMDDVTDGNVANLIADATAYLEECQDKFAEMCERLVTGLKPKVTS